MKYWKQILMVTCVFSAYAGWCYAMFHGHVDPILYQNRGIDISHYQGKIDWDALQKDPVDFVYMKATEGNDYLDSEFKRNWKESKRVGIPRGAYLFMTFCSPPEQQAKFFIKKVPKDQDALPPVIDVEFNAGCKNVPSNEEMQDRLEVVYDKLHEAYGVEPIVYTTPAFYEKHLLGTSIDRFWVASWGVWPFWKPNWLIWQTVAGELSESNGDINSLDSLVDRDVLRGSLEDLRR